MKALGTGNLTTRFDEECMAMREVLNRIGDKWSVLVIVNLAGGTKRFNDLKRSLDGISQHMLTVTVRGLARDGLVQRTVHPTIPPRVDYTLTALGHTLVEPVTALAMWAQRHFAEVERARAAFERDAKIRESPP